MADGIIVALLGSAFVCVYVCVCARVCVYVCVCMYVCTEEHIEEANVVVEGFEAIVQRRRQLPWNME